MFFAYFLNWLNNPDNTNYVAIGLFLLSSIIIPLLTALIFNSINKFKLRDYGLIAFRTKWHGYDALLLYSSDLKELLVDEIKSNEGAFLEKFYTQTQDPAKPEQGHRPERIRLIRPGERLYSTDLSRTATSLHIKCQRIGDKVKLITLPINAWTYNP